MMMDKDEARHYRQLILDGIKNGKHEQAPLPRGCGYRFYDAEHTSGVAWAVYSRAEVEAFASRVGAKAHRPEEDPRERLAYLLTGWHASYHGVGRSFSNGPWLRFRGSRVLVTCQSGLDV